MRSCFAKVAAITVMLGFLSTPAVEAAIISFTDRAAFELQGSIIENYGFEDFEPQFSSPGDPWTAHGITYRSDNNLIVGKSTIYKPISNIMMNNFWSPLQATISNSSTHFTMFGFDLATIGNTGSLTMTVNTNLNSYVYTDISVPIVSADQEFYGFVAGSGEYFTGITIVSPEASGYGPTIDNVTLGQVVPEPSAVLLIGLGIAGLGLYQRSVRV